MPFARATYKPNWHIVGIYFPRQANTAHCVHFALKMCRASVFGWTWMQTRPGRIDYDRVQWSPAHFSSSFEAQGTAGRRQRQARICFKDRLRIEWLVVWHSLDGRYLLRATCLLGGELDGCNVLGPYGVLCLILCVVCGDDDAVSVGLHLSNYGVLDASVTSPKWSVHYRRLFERLRYLCGMNINVGRKVVSVFF